MSSPINRLIDAVMKCCICAAPMGKCNCWDQCYYGYRHEVDPEEFAACSEQCSCGWFHYPGVPCFNPNTKACTSRVKFGKWNRKTKMYD